MGSGFRDAEDAGVTGCGEQLDTKVKGLHGRYTRRLCGGFKNHE